MENRKTLSILNSCLKCNSKCCKSESPIVLEKERDLILKQTEKDYFKREENYYIIPNDPCPYLKNNICSIEDIKPIDCKAYPLTIIEKEGNLFIGIYENCPGLSYINDNFLKEVKTLFNKYSLEEKKMLAKLNFKQNYSHKFFSEL